MSYPSSSSVVEKLQGKRYALRTLYRMWRHLENWDSVWSTYRRGVDLPPLTFRRGFTMHHGQWDSPISLLHDVYSDRLYSRCLRAVTHGVVIDIGANIGAAVLDIASRCKGAEIHAYEPNPAACRTLVRNLKENAIYSRVTVYEEAVTKSCDGLQMWVDVISVGCSGYLTKAPNPSARLIDVASVDLDTVIGRCGGREIALLKIDAEGAEVDILEGARANSLDSVRQAAVEYHEGILPGAAARCRTALLRHKFECSVLPNHDHPGIGMVYGWR